MRVQIQFGHRQKEMKFWPQATFFSQKYPADIIKLSILCFELSDIKTEQGLKSDF